MNARHSWVISTLRTAKRSIESSLGNSTSVSLYRRTVDRTESVFKRSFIARMSDHLTSSVRASRFYRWFTAEPEPDVIVIDLRDTWTVGPVLAVLDRVVDPLTTEWGSAKSHSLVDRLFEKLAARPVQVMSVIALIAIVTDLVLSAVSGTLGRSSLGLSLLGVSIALAGSRIRVSWAEVSDSRSYQLLCTLLEPPEPPADDETR